VNALRKAVYFLALLHFQYSPIQRGKWRFLAWLSSFFGNARYERRGLKLLLKPVSLLDRMLITGADPNPVLSHEIETLSWESGLFLDVGANIGYFSLLAASKGAEVAAFEPSPRELIRLYRNLAANGTSKVTVFPVALSDFEGEKCLSLSREGNPGLNSLDSIHAGQEKVSVKVSRLSSILAPAILERVRLVKLDVEGHELHALRGMQNVMSSLEAAKFVVEITPSYLERAGHTATEVYEFFSQHRFIPLLGIQNQFQWDEVFVSSFR
jgi:FkbM family methyltransferase